MPRIGVCDDDPSLCKKIAEIVSEAFLAHDGDYNVEFFTDGVALLAKNQIEPFDALFLDIDMPRVGGFDIAKSLREDFSHCLIVFVTSHAELVFESFDFQPFNFIRKNSGVPLGESIPKIVNKLVYHLKQDEKIIIEDDRSRKSSVFIRDIVYIEGSGHYVIYHISERGHFKRIKSRKSLQECQAFLESYNFVRIHKGYIANLSHITYINNSQREVELMDSITLPLGKLYKQSVDEKYNFFLRTKI